MTVAKGHCIAFVKFDNLTWWPRIGKNRNLDQFRAYLSKTGYKYAKVFEYDRVNKKVGKQIAHFSPSYFNFYQDV